VSVDEPVVEPVEPLEPVVEPAEEPVEPLEPVEPNEPELDPGFDELAPLEVLLWSLRHVRLTRSPLFTERRLATALPSTGSVTLSDAEADDDEVPDWLTCRTVIVFDDSSAEITSAVTRALCLPLADEDVSRDDVLPLIEPDVPVLDPVDPLDPP